MVEGSHNDEVTTGKELIRSRAKLTALKSRAPVKEISPEERRARKQERREKQRQANGGRALKMRAARLAAELKWEPKPTSRSLPVFNVGCSGWFYWHWREAFYPAGRPPGIGSRIMRVISAPSNSMLPFIHGQRLMQSGNG